MNPTCNVIFGQTFSPREEQVATLMAEGLQNNDIASRLGISVQTVKNHTASIYAASGCRNRTQVAVAYERARHVALVIAAKDLYSVAVGEHGHDESHSADWPSCLPAHMTMKRCRAAIDTWEQER